MKGLLFPFFLVACSASGPKSGGVSVYELENCKTYYDTAQTCIAMKPAAEQFELQNVLNAQMKLKQQFLNDKAYDSKQMNEECLDDASTSLTYFCSD